MKTRISTVLLALGVAALAANPARANEAPVVANGDAAKAAFAESLPVEQAVLTAAPHVPPPITRKFPARVVVNLEIKEVVKQLADGVDYTFWTFGGEVPGLFIRVREGDLVEFHLHNHPSSKVRAAERRRRSPRPVTPRRSPSRRSIPASSSITAPPPPCRCTWPTACMD